MRVVSTLSSLLCLARGATVLSTDRATSLTGTPGHAEILNSSVRHYQDFTLCARVKNNT